MFSRHEEEKHHAFSGGLQIFKTAIVENDYGCFKDPYGKLNPVRGYTLSEMFIGLAADIPFSQAKKEGPDL